MSSDCRYKHDYDCSYSYYPGDTDRNLCIGEDSCDIYQEIIATDKDEEDESFE